MGTISRILDSKSHAIITARPTDSVISALKVLAEYNIGALPVVSGDRLVGIFSERDYARKVVLQSRSSADTEVQAIMTSNVICAHPRQTVQECMKVMTDHHIRHLPVIDGDRLVGMLSIGDLVKAIIDEQQFQIEQLESYIRS